MNPDLRIYKTETTRFWSDNIVRKAGRLFGVYLFDANLHVRCAELTPSYEMNYLGPTWTGVPEEQTEEERDRLFDQIIEGDAGTDWTMYVHVRSVNLDDCEKVEYDEKEWLELLDDHAGDRKMALNDLIEERSEYLRGNGWIY